MERDREVDGRIISRWILGKQNWDEAALDMAQ
jgi:hypothetical protein